MNRTCLGSGQHKQLPSLLTPSQPNMWDLHVVHIDLDTYSKIVKFMRWVITLAPRVLTDSELLRRAVSGDEAE